MTSLSGGWPKALSWILFLTHVQPWYDFCNMNSENTDLKIENWRDQFYYSLIRFAKVFI